VIKAPAVLTIDIGSSSARAAIYDSSGEPVPQCEGRVRYEMRVSQDGGVEADPERLAEAVETAIDHALACPGTSDAQLAGVGVSCFWHSLLGIDSSGRATTPVYTWEDTRSAPMVEALREQFDESEVHARTGCRFHSSYFPAKLLWLRETGKDSFPRSARWLGFGEYFLGRLFGRHLSSHSMASGTGLYLQNARSWDAELLDFLDLDAARFAPFAAPGESLRGLRAPYDTRWPKLAPLPWFPALGDGACSNIGTGCTSPERLALMIGTSGALRVLREAERVEIPAGLWCYRADERRFLLGGALSNGGLLFSWLRERLQLGDPSELEEKLAAEPADGHGLTFLPFLAGERSMGWHSEARAAIAGLRVSTRAIEILRAGLEAVALGCAEIAEAIRSTTPGVREVVCSGGGLLHSRTWIGIMADALACPVLVSAEEEGSSRGAALKALEQLGIIRDVREIPAHTGETVPFDPGRAAVYARARERRLELYRMLVGER